MVPCFFFFFFARCLPQLQHFISLFWYQGRRGGVHIWKSQVFPMFYSSECCHVATHVRGAGNIIFKLAHATPNKAMVSLGRKNEIIHIG